MTDAPYVTTTALYADSTLGLDPSVIDATTLAGLVTAFENITERYCKVAFTTRTVTGEKQRVHGERWQALRQELWWQVTVETSWPEIQSVTAMTLDGTSLDVTTLNIDYGPGVIRNPSGFYPGLPVTIDYTHGLPSRPELVWACKQWVRSRVARSLSGVPRDVITQGLPDGGSTRYSTPDWKAGRPTGLLDVDATLNSLPNYRHGVIG